MMLSKYGGRKTYAAILHTEDVDCDGASKSKLRQIKSSQTQRREANYLQVIARAPESLSAILTSHPYDMPVNLLDKLGTSHDVRSISTIRSGVHSDSECVTFFLVSWLLASRQHIISSYQLHSFFQTILRTTWLFLPGWPSCGANRVTRSRERVPCFLL